jgi:metallo-beta-lactamase family protein
VLARINDLVESGRVSSLPVYLDSPMAVEATRSFAMHPEAYSEEARRLLHAGDRPLEFPGLKLVQSVEESKAINAHPGPCVIISASGMCTAGRVKHHLKNHISDARNTILFVGFQAEGTLGRAILSGTSPVRIFGEWHVVGARVESIEGFSAHADLDELLAWHVSLNGNPKRTFVVHGEEAAARGLASELRARFGARPKIPRPGQSFALQ